MNFETLHTYIQEFVRANELPGLAAAVVQNDQVILAEGYGVRSAGNESPVTEQTLFHMASVSKPYSATAVMQLVERGKLDLDEKVTTYLPYFTMADERFGDITLRQMLSHGSGMPDVNDYEWGNPYKEADALERYVRSLADKKLSFEPDTSFAYSNIAYEILGDVISKASGLTFEEYMRVNIFAPLGMRDSTFFQPEVPEALSVTPHVRVVDNQRAPVYPYNRAHAPSSTLHMNARDACRWMQANLNRGILERKRILKAESYDLLWKPHRQVDDERQVGLSWFLGERHGLQTISHGGGDVGFRSMFMLIPERGLGVTVMTNVGPAAMLRLAENLLDLQLGYTPEAPRKPMVFPVAKAYVTSGLQAARETMRACQADKDHYDPSPEHFMLIGGMLNDDKKPQQALDILKLGLELAPDSGQIHAGLAWVLRGLDQPEQARLHLMEAQRLEPDDPIVKVVQRLMSVE